MTSVTYPDDHVSASSRLRVQALVKKLGGAPEHAIAAYSGFFRHALSPTRLERETT